MTRISLFLTVLFLLPIAGLADNTPPASWGTPIAIGSGSNPVFGLDANHHPILTFEGEERPLRARLQENGTWTSPAPLASPLPENTIETFTSDGKSWVAQEKDEQISVTATSHNAPPANTDPVKGEVVVEKQEKTHLQLLHFSIDRRGISHLLFSRTPFYDCEANNPGGDVFYRRGKGSAWEKEIPITKKMSLTRIWQRPGVAVGAQGHVFICSYENLYTIDPQGGVRKELIPVPGISMPLALAVDGDDTLHLVYHPDPEKVQDQGQSLFHVTRRGGAWGKPVNIGHLAGEQTPGLIMTTSGELHAAWVDPNGSILVVKPIVRPR